MPKKLSKKACENVCIIGEIFINSAMHRNTWMKYHVDKWEEYGVMARVMKLKNAFQEHMDKQLLNKKSED